MDRNEFAKTLKNLRESNQITKSELARVSGFSRQAIHNWEKGTDSISLENADKLFKALGMTISIGKNQ
jgi:transcriptional regulator with XRE-family HTH domain